MRPSDYVAATELHNLFDLRLFSVKSDIPNLGIVASLVQAHAIVILDARGISFGGVTP